MHNIMVSFFSIQPMVISGLKDFFSKKGLIIPSFTSDFRIFDDLENKIIVVDDGSLNRKQMRKIIAGLPSAGSNVILFTAHAYKEYFFPFLVKRIGGIVSKSAKLQTLEEAIVNVALREKYFCKYIKAVLNNNEDDGSQNKLTKAEQKVLELLIKGRTRKEIAEELYISADTVYTHIHNIKLKLGLDDIKEINRTMAQII